MKVSKQQKKLQKLLKSKREIVKSFKTFLGNCDILKNLPNSVKQIKKCAKRLWIDESFLLKGCETCQKSMKTK